MTIKEYDKALRELQSVVASLTEENGLLRDFTYNVDPNAKVLHAHMFNHSLPQDKSARSLSVNSARGGGASSAYVG